MSKPRYTSPIQTIHETNHLSTEDENMIAHKKQLVAMRNKLIADGYVVDLLPAHVFSLLRECILTLINNSKDINDIRGYTSSLSDDEFRKVFSKERRFIPNHVALLVQSWCEDLKEVIQASAVSISPVSKNEINKNKSLKEGDKDVFFRCVRPNQDDVAPAHYDAMFWEIMKGTDSEPNTLGYQGRWKVWIPIFCCNQNNSLNIMPGSHLEKVPPQYTTSKCQSYATTLNQIAEVPGICESWLLSNESRFFCPDDLIMGSFLLFNDNLVHRGPKNKDIKGYPRISCEFTLLSKT
jgi:hypothetical protein